MIFRPPGVFSSGRRTEPNLRGDLMHPWLDVAALDREAAEYLVACDREANR